MTRFAYIFNHELTENGLAYIHFNARAERVSELKNRISSVVQSTHQQATEKTLLKLVQQRYPTAHIYEDDKQYRYVKK